MIKGYFLLNIIILFILIVPELSKGNSIPDSLNQTKPRGFLENKGQFHDEYDQSRPEVKFIWSDNKYKIILKEKGFSYELFFIDKPDFTDSRQDSVVKYKFHRIDVEFINAQLPSVIKNEPSSDYDNYYFGNEFISGKVRNYSKVIYKNIYHHIDLVYSLTDGKPKYDFILFPGADITNIKLRYRGAEKITLSNNEIIIKTSLGNIIENIPISFQYNGEIKEEIDVRYVLSENMLSFKCPSYNEGKILIIDPVPSLLWRKAYPVTPESNGIDTDSDNNIIITGTTWNTSIIATSGAYQGSYNGGTNDAFIIKYSSSGVKLWGTYYGGSEDDIGLDVVIDKNDNIIISGKTTSTDLPVPGAYQSNFGGGIWFDGFVTKFNSSGSLIWGTYFGTNASDEARAVKTDSKNNIVIAGNYDRLPFVAKLNAGGTRMWVQSFGIDLDEGNDIAVDNADNIAFIGITKSNSNISTIGSHQELFGGGEMDGFLAKYDSNGTLKWRTYYGGTKSDYINRVMTDKNNNIIIGGITGGNDNIITPGAFETINLQGSGTGFYVKFNPSGIRQWGTYYGDYARVFGMESDSSGNYFFTGEGQGPDLPFPTPYYGGSPSYIAGFDSLGQRFWNTAVYSIYSDKVRDDSYDLAIDREGSILITGVFFHPTYTLEDIFISKYGYCPNLTPVINRSGPLIKCREDSIMLSAPATSSYLWQNGKTTQTIYAKDSGKYYFTITNIKGCSYNSDTISITNKFINRIINTKDSLICPGKKILLVSDTVARNFTWSTGETSDSIYVNTTGTISLNGLVHGCKAQDSIYINSFSTPNIIFSQDTVICPNSSLVLHSLPSIDSLKWSTGLTNDSIYIHSGGIYYINGYFNQCPVSDTISLSMINQENISIGNDTSLCEGQSILIGETLPSLIYKWSTNETAPIISVSSAKNYYVDIYKGNCLVGSDSININKKHTVEYNIPNLLTANDDGLNEEFYLQGLIPQTEVAIYNIWGTSVYKTDNYQNNWRPDNLGSGIYYYHIYNKTYCISEDSGWLQIIK